MSDNKPVPVFRKSRRGRPNKSSMTVRLALHSMDFDGVTQWVKAYKQLEDLLVHAEDGPQKLAVLKTKFERLEKLFEFIHPKLKDTDILTQESIEMEQEPIGAVTASEQDTQDLLDMLNEPKK